MTKKLMPLAELKRLLVSVEGNHEARIHRAEGLDVARVLADNLGVPYYQHGVVLYLRVGQAARSSGRHDQGLVSYTIYLTHGSSSGRKPGSKANRLEEMSLSIEGLDAIIVWHTHQAMAFRNATFSVDPHNKKVVERDRLYINCGSFLRWQGYAQTMAFTPGCATMPVLRLSGNARHMEVTL